MVDFKAMACNGLMYWYFQAENEIEAQGMAEVYFRRIREIVKNTFNTKIINCGISIIQAKKGIDD